MTELRVELPRLRPGPAPERLNVAGDGIEVLSSRLQGRSGPETVWTVRIRAAGPPRPVALTLRASFPDGRAVEVGDDLTVVPPSQEDPFPWQAAAAGAVLAVALAAFALRLSRRRA